LVVRLKKIKLYAEIADENGKKYLEEKPNLVEILAKYNQELYERFILSKCDRVYIFTDYLEKKISSRIDNKRIYRTVPSIIDITSFNSQKKNNILEINQANIAELKRNDRIKITYAGACNRTNGLEFFLRCFSNVIKQKDVNVKIFFFFGYGNVDKVKAICNELDISDYVHIFSAVFPKFIPSIYHHSDILVLPEHGDVVADAGFPGKTAEYLASGKAIIATDFSDLSKYLINGYNAMICDRGDSNRYSENLLSLLLGENLRKTIGKNAYQTALNKFNVKSAMTAYLN